MNLPAHSSLRCELETYEPTRPYPHTRVQPIWTSPPASITHLTTPLRTSPLVTNPAYPWPSYQERGKETSMQNHLQRTPATALPPDAYLGTARRTRSRPPSGVFLPLGACPHNPLCYVAYRLVELLLPPGATPVKTAFYWFRHFQGFSKHIQSLNLTSRSPITSIYNTIDIQSSN